MIARNLAELFIQKAKENKNKVAIEYRLRRNEPYRTISWAHFSVIVQEVIYGLRALGLKKGDNIAILSGTRYEWSICDLAILSCGGVVVPIYPTLGEEAVNYILNNSECKIIILEDKGQLQKIRAQWHNLPNIKYAIVIEDLGDLPENDPRILSLRRLKDIGKLNFSKDPELMKNCIQNVGIDDVCTIIYTSGTTGLPKGVVLTHKNILSVLSVLPKHLPLKKSDKFLSFLPLSHVFERVGGLHYAISSGITVCYCSNVDQIASALKDSKATVMLLVPRILEKIHAKLKHQFESLPESKKKLFDMAFSIGAKKITSRKNIIYLFLNFIADRLVFKEIRKKLAPKLRCFISGGAPLSKEIAEFFWIIGMPVLEGYGLTETSAPLAVNSIRENKLGTVGKPLSNVEVKIDKDGEILIKGPTVFSSYYKNENATKEAFLNGWFKTGDIGIIDEDGFLKITDRKKDIIVNSAGKNISPQNIENALKASSYISNVVVIGDRRKYLSALVTLEINSVINVLGKKNVLLDGKGKGEGKGKIEEMVKNPEVIRLIDEEIKLKTALFADYEQIRRFAILPEEFTIESGEITPTLKVKRKYVEEKYKDVINAMYPAE